VAGVALHAVQSAAVHRHDGALHVNQVVLAQLLAVPFLIQLLCHKRIWLASHLVGCLVIRVASSVTK
jgi:hypothetical protein